MKISYNWLKEFVDINETPEELAELLTMHSFEVEEIIFQGKGLEDVVVGEVLEKQKHPDADKLSVVKVKVSADEILEIVCGASNIDIGQKVLVAKLGALIPCGLKIEKRKVRGVESCGMVCAEDELGLGTNHEGIMILNEKTEIGTLAQEALGLDDVIFEIDILPNRAHDCLCHFGVAREVAVLLNKKLKNKNESQEINKAESTESLTVKIENEQLCRRYSAVIVNNIHIKKSPNWLKRRLESCDVRSINNIVDITNFVMFSFGQPMHAFDADKLQGKIIVRNAKKGEKMMALDEKEYDLEESDLVIADKRGPIAIAGVMGGLNTAIDENTHKIIFEAANFQGTSVRRTCARLKLSSESSFRFEREIDPELTLNSLVKAVKMSIDLADGELLGNIIDIYSNPEKKRIIKFNFGKIKNLLGISVTKEKVFNILLSLGFEVSEENNEIQVLVPTFRKDVQKANDIIEEISRINGYEKIKEDFVNVKMKSVVQDKALLMEKKLREVMEGFGFFEVYNYSFIGENEIKGVLSKVENHLELQNPLSEEFMYLRTSLLPDLLNNSRDNLKHRGSFKLFELGKVYLKKDEEIVNEKKIIAGVIVNKNKMDNSFYNLKGQLENLLKKIRIGKVLFKNIDNPESFWHQGRSAEILSQNKSIGKCGEIHPIVLNNFDLDSRIFYFEIYLEELVDLLLVTKKYQKINKFPEVLLDLSMVFDEDIQWSEIEKTIKNVDNRLIRTVEPFDIYRGENLGKKKKSIAFRISYQAEDRTLKDEEVKAIQDQIIKNLEKLGGEVRK